jgi:hypothetical protein
MKLVFLDVDGVLNHAGWLQSRRRHEDVGMQYSFRNEEELWSACSIDPACVARLNRLYDVGARFVLSSTWRGMHTLPVMNRLLGYHGFTGILVGATPSLPGQGRGREIYEWMLAMNFEERPPLVILDDDSDMSPYMAHLVQTDYEMGLTDAHVERALKILGA